MTDISMQFLCLYIIPKKEIAQSSRCRFRCLSNTCYKSIDKFDGNEFIHLKFCEQRIQTMFIKKAFLLLVSLGWSCMAASGEVFMIGGVPVEITDIDVNGAGCPSDSVTVTATEENTQMVVLFSEYRAITDSANTVASSDCNIAIGLAVPAGFSVGVVGVDWRGTVVAGAGAFINFHREFFFSGTQGPSNDDYWFTPGFENFFLEDDPVFAVYSACDGLPLIARADTSATVVGANSLFTLRSADFESELLMTLNVQTC